MWAVAPTRWNPRGRDEAPGGRASVAMASPTAALSACAGAAAPPAELVAELSRSTTGMAVDGENGMRTSPPGVAMTSALTSAKRASMRCSRQSCRTDRSVNWNPGTNRTLRKTSRRLRPVESLATTGMSPMWDARYSRQSAALKRSSQGRRLVSAPPLLVREPEQPESAWARMTSKPSAGDEDEEAERLRLRWCDGGSRRGAARLEPVPWGSHGPRYWVSRGRGCRVARFARVAMEAGAAAGDEGGFSEAEGTAGTGRRPA